MTGRNLLHYQILQKLGEGGMGAVYKARDTHLNRFVAVKVLPPDCPSDGDRKLRFVQEAQAASALNHPNIVTIHDVASDQGTDFIVMEFVAGKPLDQVIPRKGMRLGETLTYAIQIADALTRAHAAGIVHRDLKPSNIMVTEEGAVKVLDFGLAKLIDSPTPSQEGDEATRTLKPLTEAGTILGTVNYMSPEQAEGKKVDARSDIFSFGVVLYEMLTGQRAFGGETKMSTLAAIMTKEPKPPSEIPVDVPREMEKLVARCLRKDPGRRFQHMDDVKIALEELKEDSESGQLSADVAPLHRARRLPMHWTIMAAAALVLATAGVTWWLAGAKRPAQGPALSRVTFDAGLTAYPALTPDGKLLAYASDRGGEGNLDIWVQQIGSGAPIQLTRHPADDRAPAFSPDGTKIAFRSERDGGGIYVIPALGGEERMIVERGHDPQFSPDGSWIAYWTGDPSVYSRCKSYVIPVSGGQPRQVQAEFYSVRQPLWSPDSKHLLFWGAPRAEGQTQPNWDDWWVTPLEGGAAVRTQAGDVFGRERIPPLFREPGSWVGNTIIFAAGTGDNSSLWRAHLSPSNWRFSPPERLTSSTALHYQPAAVADKRGQPVIAFTSSGGNPGIWSLPIDGRQGRATDEPRRLTASTAADMNPALAQDGRKIVFTSNRSGNQDIWIRDLITGKEQALTATPQQEGFAYISPDGARVAYASFESDKMPTYTIGVGGGAPKKVTDGESMLQSWTPDSKSVVVRKSVTGQAQMIAVDVETGAERPVLKHSKLPVAAPRYSRDGGWIAFQTVISSLARQIFVAPVRNGAGASENEWIPITDGSGLDRNSAWSPDGNLLYFLSERDGFRCIWAQKLEPASKRPAGAAFALAHFHQARRSLLPFSEVGEIGLSVGPDKLYFCMPELTGNIWLAKFE
jgi:eukaryotic-like serine/threonine-protein kinase